MLSADAVASAAGTKIDIATNNFAMRLSDGSTIHISGASVHEADAAIDVDTRGNLLLGRGGLVVIHAARLEQPGMTFLGACSSSRRCRERGRIVQPARVRYAR